jgi:hypothetical protein
MFYLHILSHIAPGKVLAIWKPGSTLQAIVISCNIHAR